jgi:hypothetical protein
MPFGGRHTTPPGATFVFFSLIGLFGRGARLARRFVPMMPGTTMTGTTRFEGTRASPLIV